MKVVKGANQFKLSLLFTVVILFFLSFMDSAHAATLGTVAKNMTSSMAKLAALIGVGSYVAGLGFAIGAIMKFKQHKDNPTQIPVGTPIALVFIAASLLFLPSLMATIGDTMFTGGGKVAGTSGSWTAITGSS